MKLIDGGHVTVDGEQRQKRYKVTEGQTIDYEQPEEQVPEPKGDAPFTVAYEAEDFLIVDKPAGVVAHPAKGHHSGTLADAVGGYLVHRLDKDTSGLLLVAKTEAAHRRLKEQLQRREITREYLALVKGRPPSRTGTIDAAIGRDRTNRTRHSPTPTTRATRSRTSRSSRRCRTRRCCGCAWRPAAPTRSASTSRRSATRSSATPNTARRTPNCRASSSTRRACSSTTST